MGVGGRQGPALWTSYVQFEFAHAEEPLSAIQKLYRRQLAVPHLGAPSAWARARGARSGAPALTGKTGCARACVAAADLPELETTWAAYQAFEQQRAPAEAEAAVAAVEATYKKTAQETEARRPYEARLAEVRRPQRRQVGVTVRRRSVNDVHVTVPLRDDSCQATDAEDNLHAFLQYIDFEAKQKPVDHFRVRTLYERAIARHSLRPDLWTRFTDYMVTRRRTGMRVQPRMP